MALAQVSKIHGNQSIDQLIKIVSYDKKYVIEVANFTRYTLKRVGTHNDSENWPLGNIFANELAIGQFSTNFFSFGVNYQIEETASFIQLAASLPLIGAKKIQVGNINQSGNYPAKRIWDAMNNSSAKSTSNDSIIVRAYLKEEGWTNIWLYEIREN